MSSSAFKLNNFSPYSAKKLILRAEYNNTILKVRQFIVLVGNNGTGKTYYSSHNFPKEYVIVRPDDLEGDLEEKQTKMFKLIEKGLADNNTVVLDGMNLEKITRNRLLYFTRNYPVCRKIIYDFGPGDELDIEVLAKERPWLSFKKWEEIFAENRKLYQRPTLDEGFDEILIIRNGSIINKNQNDYANL